MQTYDYTEEGLISGEVYDAIAKMRGHELAKVHKAILKMKEDDKKEREEKLSEWFATTILPVLKDVAESVDALLEIQEDKTEFAATIKHSAGFEVEVDAKRLRMALYMADVISMENMDEELWFTLVYKKDHLVK
ncbi:MAG: hypothetical protein E7246_00895 [Lachnoclostridium sp.]|nr:hypothetical protein [Lachnoclostridium sp.]